MSEHVKVVTVTMNPCIDLSGEVEFLIPDKKLRCRNFRREPGGGGINVSRAIALLGGRSAAVYPSGGSAGRFITGFLQDQGVDPVPVEIDDWSRDSFAVTETDSGNQYRFSMPGTELPEQAWQTCMERALSIQPPPRYLVASGSLARGVDQHFYADLAERCRSKSIKMVLDTPSREALEQALETGVFLIKPNSRELEDLCRNRFESVEEQERACRELIEQTRCENIALSLGPEGAILTTPERQMHTPGLKVEEASSIGAGDSFVGGMTLALQRGEDIHRAFLYGMAAGTAALMTKGTELCRKDDTERFYRRLLDTQGETV